VTTAEKTATDATAIDTGAPAIDTGATATADADTVGNAETSTDTGAIQRQDAADGTARAGWYPDPHDSSRLRWWDGRAWTRRLTDTPVREPKEGVLQPALDAGTMSGPAGWYDDPSGADHNRWWNGTGWTDHTSPKPSEATDSALSDYVPFGGRSWKAESVFGEHQAPVRRNTAGAWGLALSPWIVLVASAAVVVLTLFAHELWWTAVAAAVLPLLVTITMATRDRLRLSEYGYVRRPALGWVLLTPLVYLIVRTVHVRRENGGGSAPLWFYLVNCVLVLVALAGGVFATANYEAGLISTRIEQASDITLATQGYEFLAVDCPETLSVFTPGTEFSCNVVDGETAKSAGKLDVTITGRTGQYTAKFVPIAG
jgi:hypothetical protein